MSNRKKKYETLPEISFGKRPKVLLVGNGITRPFHGAKNISDIIRDEWKKNYPGKLPDSIWEQPFPLQVVIATKDHVNSCMENLAVEFKKMHVASGQKELIENILNVGFDAILSTNYSLEIERSVMPSASDRKIQMQYITTKKQTDQQKQLGIYQGTKIPYANNPILWHIHGTAFRKKSMVMGQYYYGKLLSEVVQRATEVVRKYRYSIEHGVSFTPESWIDYFLVGDVFCLGFGMALSESDIWWLLSLKKSAFSETSFTLYEREKTNEVNALLFDAYEIKRPDVSAFAGEDYEAFYNNICSLFNERK